MIEKKDPLVVLGVQGQTLQERAGKAARQKAATNRRNEGLPLWYICTIAVIVAVLSYMMVPAVRERTALRLAQLSGQPAPVPQMSPGATPEASGSASQPILSSPTSTLPSSQAAAAEAYFAASMARQKPSGGGPGAKPAVQDGKSAASRQSDSSEIPSATPSKSSRMEMQPKVIAPLPSNRGTPPVLVRRKGASEAPEEPPNQVVAEPPPSVEPNPTPSSSVHSEEAYKLLLDKVPAMASVAAKSDPALQLKGWSVVKAEESEVWIDLVAIRSVDKQEEHFIWKIRIDEQTVFPLNQNARRMVVK